MKMKRLLMAVALLSMFFLVTTSFAKPAQQINSEADAALKFFTQRVKGGSNFLKSAKGVLIMPNIIKAGLGVGGQYGEGVLRIGGKTVDYYSLAGGSIGFQIGAQKTNLILVFTQEEALKNFRASSGWKSGVDGSVAFAKTGAGAAADTINVKDPIVGFLFGQEGIMAAATIEGAKFTKLAR
jgi:lipid-binding SYLF domain-containing protein